MMLQPSRSAATTFFVERVANIEARRLQCWNDAEEQSGQHRHAHRKPKNATVHADRAGAWQRGRELRQERHAPGRHQHAGSATETRQHDALDDQLPKQPTASGTERGAHCDFLLAINGTREQQVCDIRAGNQQHERDRAHEHQQSGTHVLHELIAQSRHARPHLAVERRILML